MFNYRNILLILMCAATMTIDSSTNFLHPVRFYLGYILQPVNQVVQMPEKITKFIDYASSSDKNLEYRIESLLSQNLVLNSKIQKLISLQTENMELKNLLNAKKTLTDRVLATQVIDVDYRNFQRVMFINRGSKDGVFVGQPVIDEKGLIGQVVEVHIDRSKVLIITDVNHSIPVQRKGLGERGIAVGVKKSNELQLLYAGKNTSFQIGDEFITSGLGGRFPFGYPVGTVKEIEYNKDKAKTNVIITPAANIRGSRQLLLIFHLDADYVPPSTLWAK
jgi:rod shape-determining protein MreC